MALVAVPVTAELGAVPTRAEPSAVTVWRCPGPPVLYTDRLSPAQVQAQHCTVVQEVPVATGAKAGVRTAAPPRGAASSAEAAGPSGVRISPAEQQVRDTQARRILEAELLREEQRLAKLDASQTDQIRRTKADIEAIRRELARLR